MTQSTAPHWQYLSTTIGKFVDEYVMPSLLFDLSSTKNTTQDSDASRHGIHNYACSFMADLLLVEEFNDAVHEGDGERMLTIWKLLLLHFRTTGHTNYAAESVRLIAEASALLTERGAHRLKWCRFINTNQGRTFPVTLEWNTGIVHSSSTWLLLEEMLLHQLLSALEWPSQH